MRTNLTLLTSIFIVFLTAISIPVKADTCNIDVYGLYVSGSTIHAYIENNGDSLQTVDYVFYVNDEEIVAGVTDIDIGERQRVTHNYNFATGYTEVSIEAESSCGSFDSESLVLTRFDDWDCTDCDYCIEGAIRCDCESRKVYECIDDDWELIAHGENEYCEICGDDDCCGLSDPFWDCDTCGCDFNDDPDDRTCGVYIEELTYIENIKEGEKGEVEFTVINTGNHREVIALRLFVDGIMKDSNSVSLTSDGSVTRTFSFYPTVGTHEVKVSAKSSCGSSDWFSRIIKVIDMGNHIEPPKPPEPDPEPTSIDITPARLDIARYDAKAIAINIHSEVPQYFRVEVRDYDFDREWMEYEREFYVEGDKTEYIYIRPQEYGEYELDVHVTGRTEWKMVKEHVTFFVAKPDTTPIGFDIIGDFIYFFTHPATVLVVIIISFGLVIYGSTKLIIPEPEPWEA